MIVIGMSGRKFQGDFCIKDGLAWWDPVSKVYRADIDSVYSDWVVSVSTWSRQDSASSLHVSARSISKSGQRNRFSPFLHRLWFFDTSLDVTVTIE